MAIVFVPYTVVLDDADLVNTLNAAPSRWNKPRNDIAGALTVLSVNEPIPLGATGKLMCGPNRALLEYPTAVIYKMGSGLPVSQVPYIWSMWIWDDNSDTYPLDVDTWVEEDPNWENPLTSSPPRLTRYIWSGRYAYGGPDEVAVDTFSRLRWFEGFEHDDMRAMGESTGAINRCCPEASRHLGQKGYYICEDTGSVLNTIATNKYRTGLTPASSWERLYLRIRTAPVGVPHFFWSFAHSLGGSRELMVAVTPLGQLALYNQTGAGVQNLLGTTGVQSFGSNAAWLKLDMVVAAPSSGAASATLYINGVVAMTISSFPNSGWGIVGAYHHSLSSTGTVVTNSSGACLHLDDWSSHDVPTAFDANDFLLGTRIIPLVPTGFGATHNTSVWGTDPVQHLAANPMLAGEVNNYFTATDATQAPLAVTWNIAEACNQNPRVPLGGIIGAQMHMHAKMAGGGTVGALEYDVEGAGPVSTAINELTSIFVQTCAYLPSGLTANEVVTTLETLYIPGASSHLRTVAAFGAAVIQVGIYGQCDLKPVAAGETQPPANYPPEVGLQNHAYPTSPWSDYEEHPPLAYFKMRSGKYTGNGTVTTLTFPFPVQFLKVRRVTATIADGLTFWPSMEIPAEGWQEEGHVDPASRIVYNLASPPPAEDSGDPLGEVSITIVGADAKCNENAIVYQYFAVMDPGTRLLFAGALHHNHGSTSRITPLKQGPALFTDFTPISAFFRKSLVSVHIANGVWFKGRDTGSRASLVSAAETATAIDFAAGQITTHSGFNYAASARAHATSFLAFRENDWSGENDGYKAMQCFSYVGDGAASRTFNLTVTGKRPVWAFFKPANGAALFRDAGHLGTTSSVVSTGGSLTPNASTGITAGGIDKITVGSVLNANGINYSAIVFIGDDCAIGNNGWSCDGDFDPLPPIPPPCRDSAGNEVDCPCDESEDDDCGDCDDCECIDDDCSCVGEDCNDPCDPEVEDCDSDPCDPTVEECITFGDQCVTESQKICNQALSVIGVTQTLTNLITDTTVEATQCRLHYEETVKEVLRAFPWDFATKYADLQWLDGDDASLADYANPDWIWMYRLPTDLIFARRIVKPDVGREFDQHPVKFRQAGNDTNGKRLYTNYRDPEWTPTVAKPEQVTLEYTYLPSCVASHADALCRNALIWLMASKLAPGLARNKVTHADAYAMFEHIVRQAMVSNANQQQRSTVQGDPDWITER